MNNITQLRQRVINAIRAESMLWENEVTIDDEVLDNLARTLLNLPARPLGNSPYIGWLGTDSTEQDTIFNTSSKKRTSITGIDLIKRWEGWRNQAYLCPAHKWTIGYGHTKTARRGMRISKSEGERLLRQDLQVYENAVNDLVQVRVNQNQFDALVSFCYNVGRGALSQSTLLRLLNQGNYGAAADQFSRWVNGGGRKLPGLVSRRAAERQLFLL